MSMFDSYDNIPDNYVPNNKRTHSEKFTTIQEYPPYKKYAGDKLYYWWCVGDQFTFYYNPNFEIRVDKDSYILEEAPTEDLKGILNQKAYDIVNLKSYTCTTTQYGKLNWVEDKIFTFPKDGIKSVSLKNMDWRTTSVKMEILNFRREVIYKTDYDGVDKIQINIREEIADLLKQGTYYFRFIISKFVNDEKYQYELFRDELQISVTANRKTNTKTQTIIEGE